MLLTLQIESQNGVAVGLISPYYNITTTVNPKQNDIFKPASQLLKIRTARYQIECNLPTYCAT